MDKEKEECIKKLIEALKEDLDKKELINVKIYKSDYINLIKILLEKDQDHLIEKLELSRLILSDH